MNEYKIAISCGQIKYVKDFFEEYEDNQIKTTLDTEERIKATFKVTTPLSVEEAVRHLKNVFKESKYGSALHFSVQTL